LIWTRKLHRHSLILHLHLAKGAQEAEASLMTGLADAVWEFAATVTESAHSEAAPVIYEAVIGCPSFSMDSLMFAIGHLMEQKVTFQHSWRSTCTTNHPS
jgi:hypothetical protein